MEATDENRGDAWSKVRPSPAARWGLHGGGRAWRLRHHGHSNQRSLGHRTADSQLRTTFNTDFGTIFGCLARPQYRAGGTCDRG